MELQRIELLEDRSQYPRVRVKETADDNWKERICLHIDEEGLALCIEEYNEQHFLKGGNPIATRLCYYEEIKEPTCRPYKTGDNVSEVLGLQVSRKQASRGAIYVVIGVGIIDDEIASVIYKDLMIPRLYFKLKRVDSEEDCTIGELSKDLTECYEYLDTTPIGVKE